MPRPGAAGHRLDPPRVTCAATGAPAVTVPLMAGRPGRMRPAPAPQAPDAGGSGRSTVAPSSARRRTSRLLALGADPHIRDRRFDATALDWARHLHQRATAELLEPLTDR
ncbi:hypothetical protein [Dactylosporangium sp. NPDC048998]|uniref:hypothetical protein n=1 Tax=Dactylosporangium sp. NPDC048998 TaxID=3363976 RepID=UPI00371C72DE